MATHLPIAIKLKYVLRALVKKELIADLGTEITKLGLSDSFGSKPNRGWNKPGTMTIYQWVDRFIIYGVFGLGRLHRKRLLIKLDDYSKEELFNIIDVLSEIVKEEKISITDRKIERTRERLEKKNDVACRGYRQTVSIRRIIELLRSTKLGLLR